MLYLSDICAVATFTGRLGVLSEDKQVHALCKIQGSSDDSFVRSSACLFFLLVKLKLYSKAFYVSDRLAVYVVPL